MNTGSQHKMYNYEVAPPAGVWEKIVAELDESELSQKFPSLLHNMLIAPPAHAWQNIAAELDEPALVSDYANKLAGIEVAPPALAWEKIKTVLQPEIETAVPGRRRISPILKYAAAAVLVGLLAWGGMQILNNKSGDTPIASGESTQSKEFIVTPQTNPPVTHDENMGATEIAASLEEARNDAALEASKKTFARLDPSVPVSKIKNAANFFFAPDINEPGTRGFSLETPQIQSTDIADRYVMLMTPDGKIIRMSKKLSDLVCCVAGEDEDKDCIDQMKKWREKLAHPSAGHSSGNFIEILKLVNSLQDN